MYIEFYKENFQFFKIIEENSVIISVFAFLGFLYSVNILATVIFKIVSLIKIPHKFVKTVIFAFSFFLLSGIFIVFALEPQYMGKPEFTDSRVLTTYQSLFYIFMFIIYVFNLKKGLFSYYKKETKKER